MQSGSSRVLAAMRRRYNAETAESNIAYIREKIPGVTFTADIIVGFPGETEEMFMETVDFVKRVGFIHLHIFPYSRRPGTEAAEMEDQIPEETKNERLKRLEDAEREAGSEDCRELCRQPEGRSVRALRGPGAPSDTPPSSLR